MVITKIIPYFENKSLLSQMILTFCVRWRHKVGSTQNLVSCDDIRGLGAQAPRVRRSAPSPPASFTWYMDPIDAFRRSANRLARFGYY